MDKNKKSPFARILAFAEDKKIYYVFSVCFALVGAVCQILPFYVVAGIIRKLLSGEMDFAMYREDLIALAVVWLIRVLCHGISTTLSHKATFSVIGNVRKKGLLKMEKMALGDVQNKGSGELKNILVERIDSIETTLAHIVPECTGNVFVVICTLIYLFSIDWRMALASLITFPVGLLCFMLMMIGYEENYGRTVRATKNLNDTAVEYISGIEVIKVFGKAKSSYEKFVSAAKEGAAAYVDWMRKSNIYFVAAINVMPATLIAVLPIGGILLKNGTLDPFDFILIVILAFGLITPIIQIMAYNDDMAKMGTIIEEVCSIIDAKEMNRPENNIEEPDGNDIKFNDVHFGYTKDIEVLHGVSGEFKEGTFNALVGPSGGGKSTIAKLIASFWEADSGEITIGGVNIKNLSAKEYYKRVAYVSQDNFLFDTSVRENIRMGNPNATNEDVEKAAKDCGCYDFIMNLENGFDTIVGGGGSHLSGGEKQRISIARAMLKNAPIVILDEATAYTDPENEALIQESVARLVKDKTLIVIAHRLSTIKDADKIVVINKGNIDSSGTHEELLEKSALYKKLWEAHISSKDSMKGGMK